ncbi:MAG: hypothetical protein HDS06_06045 [Bacteroides sp.]|nr:hypothetical protein [Bacteroides sp.]
MRSLTACSSGAFISACPSGIRGTPRPYKSFETGRFRIFITARSFPARSSGIRGTPRPYKPFETVRFRYGRFRHFHYRTFIGHTRHAASVQTI